MLSALAAARFSAAADGAEVAGPRLLVIVSVDQLPQEYSERMRPGFAPDGFSTPCGPAAHSIASAITGRRVPAPPWGTACN